MPSTCLNLLSRCRRRLLPLVLRECHRHLRVGRVSANSPYTKSDLLSDRLPTVSASEALVNLQARGPRSISTGLDQLNAILGTSKAGLARGTMTEIWGPAGSGKTSLAYVQRLLLSAIDADIPVDYRRQHGL